MRLETLTPEQEARIPVVRQEWLDRMSQPIDRVKARQAIEAIYEFAGKAKPQHFVFTDSPMTAILAIETIR